MKDLNPKFVDEDGYLCLSGIHKDLLLQFIERFDPVVVKCDDGHYLSPMNGCDEDNAHVYSRKEAEKECGYISEDATTIISIFDL